MSSGIVAIVVGAITALVAAWLRLRAESRCTQALREGAALAQHEVVTTAELELTHQAIDQAHDAAEAASATPEAQAELRARIARIGREYEETRK